MQIAHTKMALVLAAGLTLPSFQARTTAAQEAADPCLVKIPAGLQRSLGQAFGSYRLPRMSDNLQEDIAYNKSKGGDGCLGVAVADFNGDGRSDRAVLLTSPKQDRTLLVVGLSSRDGWKIQRLRTWSGERLRLFVAVATAGRYTRAESFPNPISEPGEREAFDSSLNGIVTGRTEASGIYYFWTVRGWVHVWAID